MPVRMERTERQEQKAEGKKLKAHSAANPSQREDGGWRMENPGEKSGE
jgi:hypothetical protein